MMIVEERTPLVTISLLTRFRARNIMGYFTVWISPFAKRDHYVYSQASSSKFILIIVAIYMSLSIYYYYTKGERSDADE